MTDYKVISILFLLVVLAIIWRFCIRKHQHAISNLRLEVQAQKDQIEQTEIVLNACNTFPWMYFPKDDIISYLSSKRVDLYPSGLTLAYFLENYVSSGYRKMVLEMMEKVVSGNLEELNIKIKIITADKKQEEWGHVVGLPVGIDENGRVEKVVGTIRYITKEIQQENELKENKEFLELTMRTANIIPWEYQLDNDLLFSKTPSRQELVKPILMSDYTKYIVHPEWQDDYAREVQAVKEGRRGNNFDYKLKVLGPDREYEWSRIVGVIISHDENGKPLRMIGSTYQIDQEIKREEQLDKLRGAEEANRLKTAFLANMNHEIRTPLNAILGFSQLIAESPENANQYYPIIEANNQLLLKLIDDILDISKIESDSTHFVYREEEICNLLISLTNIYISQMPPHVELIRDCPDEKCLIRTDRARVIQIMTNFLNNAIKFTSKGSITIGYSHYGNDTIRFFVRDTGKGICQKDLPKVFERFTKLDSFVQGTGLGLSICEEVAHKLGGKIGVESEPDKGSEFWFTIPVSKKVPD